MSVVAGIRRELAESIVERLHIFRTSTSATVSTLDVAAAQGELRALVTALEGLQREFERASTGWSEEARAQKGRLRKERDQSFLQIKVALARLGERERIDRLEKLPYQQRIEDLEKYLEQMAHARRAT
jgi:hypothetical protein